MLVTRDPGDALAAPGIQEWPLAPPACQNRFSYGECRARQPDRRVNLHDATTHLSRNANQAVRQEGGDRQPRPVWQSWELTSAPSPASATTAVGASSEPRLPPVPRLIPEHFEQV